MTHRRPPTAARGLDLDSGGGGGAAAPAAIPGGDLDPGDWAAFRALCHRAVDDMVDHWQGVRERSVWRPLPETLGTGLAEPVPWAGADADALYDRFKDEILPFTLGNTHPHFWGWVHGSGTPMGALAEFLAGAVNANLGGREHAPVYVERQVVAWFKEVMGFPEKASGLLVSGTSMATLLALAIARHRTAPTSMRRDGVGAAGDKLVGYASSQAHSSVGKAFEFMGLGATKLRAIATDPQHRIDVAALDAAVEADVRAGLRPFVLVASAGTVNIGAFDDLVALRRIADRHGLWLHVDGAFGALTVLAPSERHRVDGIDAADSIAFDFHKWLHVPYDAGCVLVRDGALHQATFGGRLAYLTSAEVGAASGEPWYCDFGVELSRGFRALKVWFTLKHYGLDRLGAVIARNCAQARQLAALVEAEPELELAAAVPLNIVCLRYRGRGGLDADRLERLNRQLITRLHLDGLAIPSATALDGRTVIRVCITNHRTTDADIEAFVGQVLALGRELAAATEPATVRQP